MELLGAVFLRVLTLSAGCSAVLAPLLLLAPRIRKRVAARSFYILFLLLALRLAVPVELSLPRRQAVVTVPAPSYTVSVPAAPAPAAVQAQVAAPAPAQTETAPRPVPSVPDPVPTPAAREIPVAQLLGLVWAAGIGVCALWAAGSYLLARRRLLRGSVPAGQAEADLLERLRTEFRLRRTVDLRRSARAPSPLALGLFRPVVVLPKGGFAPEELELVLRHELTHIRRWDVAYKLVLSLACAVNWFNPLVWLMNRAAGRNLELCCDDQVVRGLSNQERQRYGAVLLGAAQAARLLPFSTCFAGGKKQMKDRLLNLFVQKKNSAALVCLVLAAALLAGGLVACESEADTTDLDTTEMVNSLFDALNRLSAEAEERRALLREYFYDNYEEGSASVVLADLTGDGLEEMLVLTMCGTEGEDLSAKGLSLREPVDADSFEWGDWAVFGVQDGAVVPYFPDLGTIGRAHVGWGFLYLVPRADGQGYAILNFRPYTGQGLGTYSYTLLVMDEAGGTAELDSGEVSLSLTDAAPYASGMDFSSPEEVEQLLDRVREYRNSGVPLLVYYEDYTQQNGNREFSYLNIPPAEAFDGEVDVSIPALRGYIATNHGAAVFPLPEPGPATAQEALERLDASLILYPDFIAFRLPHYDGTWEIQIAGEMCEEGSRDICVPVRYLEDEEWLSGRSYGVPTEGAYFRELTLTAKATGPDGTSAERSFLLAERSQVTWGRPPVHIPEQQIDDPWGVALVASDATPGGLTLTILQSGGAPTGDLEYGTEFWLDREEEGEWTRISFPHQLADGTYLGWDLIAYFIPMDGRITQPVRWDYICGELPPGRYRIGKEILDSRGGGDFDKRTYYAEFEIS